MSASHILTMATDATEELCSKHKAAFAAVCCLTSVAAIVGNVFYLYCYIRDSKLKCCFNMFLANIAVSDLMHGVVMASLNIVVLYQTDVVLCALFRTFLLLFRQEMKLVLVLITLDRIHLIKGVMQYRQFINERTALIMVTVSWVLSIAFTAVYGFYMFGVRGDSAPADYNEQHSRHCHTFSTYYLDFAHLFQLLLKIALVFMYAYVLILCRKTQRVISSMQVPAERQDTDDSAPKPRDSVANNLLGMASVQGPSSADQLDTTGLKQEGPGSSLSHRNLDDIPEQSQEDNGSLSRSPKRHEDRKRDTKDAPNNKDNAGDGGTAKDGHGKRLSVVFDNLNPFKLSGSNLDMRKEAAAQEIRGSPSPAGHCPHKLSSSLKGSLPGTPTLPKGYWSKTQTGELVYTDGAWPYHPVTKSLLHLLFTKPSSSSTWRSDAMAAQQLGVFLALHFVFCLPSSLASVLASAAKVDITSFMHWLDWLALLPAAIFPIIYCLYSPRLRSHLSPRLCPCCVTRVSPSRHSRLILNRR